MKNCANCKYSNHNYGIICEITEDPVTYTDVCQLHTYNKGDE